MRVVAESAWTEQIRLKAERAHDLAMKGGSESVRAPRFAPFNPMVDGVRALLQGLQTLTGFVLMLCLMLVSFRDLDVIGILIDALSPRNFNAAFLFSLVGGAIIGEFAFGR